MNTSLKVIKQSINQNKIEYALIMVSHLELELRYMLEHPLSEHGLHEETKDLILKILGEDSL